MKMKLLLAAFAATLTLSACGSAAEEEKPRKGKYKPEVALTALEMPGLTDDLKATIEKQLEGQFASQAREQCFGGGKKGDWKNAADDISKGLGGNCETTTDNSTADSVDNVIKCTGTQMGDIEVSLKGQAQSESFEMDINMKMMKLPAPMDGEGKLGMKISATRTGDC